MQTGRLKEIRKNFGRLRRKETRDSSLVEQPSMLPWCPDRWYSRRELGAHAECRQWERDWLYRSPRHEWSLPMGRRTSSRLERQSMDWSSTANTVVHSSLAYSSDCLGFGSSRTSCRRRRPREMVKINDQRTELWLSSRSRLYNLRMSNPRPATATQPSYPSVLVISKAIS